MGNFNPDRVTEAQLAQILEWPGLTSASALRCAGV